MVTAKPACSKRLAQAEQQPQARTFQTSRAGTVGAAASARGAAVRNASPATSRRREMVVMVVPSVPLGSPGSAAGLDEGAGLGGGGGEDGGAGHETCPDRVAD